MARLIIVVSDSGTGKSSSLRNFSKEEAAVVLCTGKELPFKNDLTTMVPRNYNDVYKVIEESKKPIIVIDDANYLMSFEEMSRVDQVGYGKFTQMASNMFIVFKKIMQKNSSQNFYLFFHKKENEDSKIEVKTTGRMLSEKVVLEGLTNILITNKIIDGEFVFKVKTDGTGIKTPLGMFNSEHIPNDLKLVDDTIRKFYGENIKKEKK